MIHRTRNPSATEKTLLTGKAICRNSLSTTNVLNQINKARRSNHQDIKYHQVSNEIEAEYLNHVTDIPFADKCRKSSNIISTWVQIIKIKYIIRIAMTNCVNFFRNEELESQKLCLGQISRLIPG